MSKQSIESLIDNVYAAPRGAGAPGRIHTLSETRYCLDIFLPESKRDIPSKGKI